MMSILNGVLILYGEIFEALKLVLVECTALSLPMKDADDYVLDTDASAFAIGSVLSQVWDGEVFWPQGANQAKWDHCIIGRELLCKNVRVFPDHGCLHCLKHIQNPSGKRARWIERLVPFNRVIQYRPVVRHEHTLP